MKYKDLISEINSIDFEGVIKQETIEYLSTAHKYASFQDKDDDKKYITNGLKRFINKNDKIVYLLEAINFINEVSLKNDELIDYTLPENYVYEGGFANYSIYDDQAIQTNQERKNLKKQYEAQIFYAVRELEKLGISGLKKDAFSQDEVIELNNKINAVLDKLNEIHFGNEIIYDTVEELKVDFESFKTDFPLGKKKWYQRTTGAIVSYIGRKGIDEIFEIIKPELKDFLIKNTTPIIRKLLN